MSKLTYQDIIKINAETTKNIGPHLAADVVKKMGYESVSLIPAAEYEAYKDNAEQAVEAHKAVNEKRAKEVDAEAAKRAKIEAERIKTNNASGN